MLVFLLSLFAVAAPEMIPEQDLEVIGRVAPSMALQTFDGQPFSLDEQRGTVVILSFWASWCGPCRKELPALAALQKERADLKIFAVNVDRDRRKAEQFLRRVPFNLPIVWDNEAASMANFGVMSMPTLFVVDKVGTVKWKKVGYSSEKGLTELMNTLKGLSDD